MTETIPQNILEQAILIPKRLIRDNTLTPHDKVVYSALSYIATKSPEGLPIRCTITEYTVSEILGMRHSGFPTSMSRLRERQYIKWEVTMTSKGWGYNIELLWN